MEDATTYTYQDLEKMTSTSEEGEGFSKLNSISKIMPFIVFSIVVSVFLVRENIGYFGNIVSNDWMPFYLAIILEIFFTVFTIVSPRDRVEKIIMTMTVFILFSFSVWISLSTVYSSYSKVSGISKSYLAEKVSILDSLKEHRSDMLRWRKKGWEGNIIKGKKISARLEKRLRIIELELANKNMGSEKEQVNGLIIMALIRVIFQLGNLLINRRIGKSLLGCFK